MEGSQDDTTSNGNGSIEAKDKEEAKPFDFSTFMKNLNTPHGKQIEANDSSTAINCEAKPFDFSSFLSSLSSNGSADRNKNSTEEEGTSNGHDDSKDDINVPLEELPIETRDNLPDVVLNNKQFDADEELVFENRCKLYRFDTSDSEEGSQWKERGIGNLTIVRRSVGTNYAYRILMRRDKVLKLCANHFIKGDMKLRPHGKNNNSFLWSTSADLSETEATSETLAARFKTVEDADRFKKAFEEAVDAINKGDPITKDKPEKEVPGEEVCESAVTGKDAHESDLPGTDAGEPNGIQVQNGS